MGFSDWAAQTRMKINRFGRVRGVMGGLRQLWGGAFTTLDSVRSDRGEYIYADDWDGLLILDACRPDALEQVSDEYEWLPAEIPTVTSRGSMSKEWMDENFSEQFREEVSQTAYITSNPFISQLEQGEFDVRGDDFYGIIESFESKFSEEMGTVPPDVVTDDAINYLRQNTPERFILHYMQPHTPYRSLDLDGIGVTGENGYRETVWDHITTGEISVETAWEHYIDNLRWVLDSVEVFLQNADAERIILSADHGECFGEYGVYGHARGTKISPLRTVPWVPISATDNRTHTPDVDVEDEDASPTSSVEEQLSHLGYR